MSDVSVTKNSQGKLEVRSPYNPSFPKAARALGGKWSGGAKVWTFDARDEERVRNLVRETYGTDGDDEVELVTLRVKADELGWNTAELWVAGRLIASRVNRDYAVRLGDGCIIVEGGFPGSGGSRKNPKLEPKDGTVIEVRDVPAPIALEEADSDHIWVVDDKGDQSDKAQKKAELLAEKAELLAKLAAVEKALEELDRPATKYDRLTADEEDAA